MIVILLVIKIKSFCYDLNDLGIFNQFWLFFDEDIVVNYKDYKLGEIKLFKIE